MCGICQKNKAFATRTRAEFKLCYSCLEKERDEYRKAAEEAVSTMESLALHVRALLDKAKGR